MRPAIFFFLDPGVRAAEEEVEGGVIGDLLGVGNGVGARDRGAGVGGAKGVPEVEGRGVDSAAAASASASCDQLMPSGWRAFFCFLASLDFFFLLAFLALFLASLSSSSSLAFFFLEASSSADLSRMSMHAKGCRV